MADPESDDDDDRWDDDDDDGDTYYDNFVDGNGWQEASLFLLI